MNALTKVLLHYPAANALLLKFKSTSKLLKRGLFGFLVRKIFPLRFMWIETSEGKDRLYCKRSQSWEHQIAAICRSVAYINHAMTSSEKQVRSECRTKIISELATVL